jgi:hypothetical protein
MKWLPREKRNPFIIVVLITTTVLALICFGLIGSQNATLVNVSNSQKASKSKLQRMETAINNASVTDKDLQDASFALDRAEGDMASGDYYSWTVNTMGLFKRQYKVEIPEIGHPTPTESVDLLSEFPYKQIRFNINGKAYYHDLGKFLADFENNFPHARVVNLVIDSNGGDGEKLTFRMDVIVLVKSS